jgi:hypothetical protein
MCDKCAKLDKKIEHYETMIVSIGDRVTVDRLMAMVAKFAEAKSGTSSRAKAVGRLSWRPLLFLFFHFEASARNPSVLIPDPECPRKRPQPGEG